jgi:hypothetical protein
MSSAEVHVQPVNAMPRVALGVAAAVIISVVVNIGVALATKALDPNGTRIGLAPAAYGSMSAMGVLAGAAGWAVVRRFASRPRAALRVLVPAVVALSFVPGIILLAGDTSLGNVVGLWVMHLVVAVVTVMTAARVLPLPDKSV